MTKTIVNQPRLPGKATAIAAEKAKAEELAAELKKNAPAHLPELKKLSLALTKQGFAHEGRLVSRVHDRLAAFAKGVNYLEERRAQMRERRSK